MTYMFKKKYT